MRQRRSTDIPERFRTGGRVAPLLEINSCIIAEFSHTRVDRRRVNRASSALIDSNPQQRQSGIPESHFSRALYDDAPRASAAPIVNIRTEAQKQPHTRVEWRQVLRASHEPTRSNPQQRRSQIAESHFAHKLVDDLRRVRGKSAAPNCGTDCQRQARTQTNRSHPTTAHP